MKYVDYLQLIPGRGSPPALGARIEIISYYNGPMFHVSPPARGARIEILCPVYITG